MLEIVTPIKSSLLDILLKHPRDFHVASIEQTGTTLCQEAPSATLPSLTTADQAATQRKGE